MKAQPCEAALALLPQRVLVGVSGGVDSVALLEALVRTGRKPIVLHVNHGWRAESAAEAEGVRSLAKNHDLPFAGSKLHPSKKTEASARAGRYAFFARAAKKFGVHDLILAHHADDQVETFLLQLLRGAGSAGSGMQPQRAVGELTLHRPWLAIWKKEIIAYARARKLTWSEDQTNTDTRHRRNLIRHKLIPYLVKLTGIDTPHHLWRAAEIARAEGEWMNVLCAGLAEQPTLSVPDLRTASVAQQRRVVRQWLQKHGVGDIAFANVEAVRALLANPIPAKINLSRGRFARRRAGVIFLA